jgi:protein SCO1/2
MRKLRLVLWGAVAIALIGLGALTLGVFEEPQPATEANAPASSAPTGAPAAPSTTGAVSPQRAPISPDAALGGPFTLVDHKGQPITEAVFRGKPSAVFFGFTHCPDVCPTTLMDMSRWADALGADAEAMRFVFVTVDPERDTPAVLDEYVSAFSNKILGITGEPEAVRAMLRDYNIPFSKVPLQDGGYSMDHLASVLLLDAEGGLAGTISRQEPSEVALAKLKDLVAG